ncbi:MAG: hypothetical protein GXO66_01990 [Euryarchaeota archaeon]|nr:hypothetical protein [Euryarchaeota archaeon]
MNLKYPLILLGFVLLLPAACAYDGGYHINRITTILDLETGVEEFHVELTSRVDNLEYFDFAYHLPLEATTRGGERLRVEGSGVRKRIYFPEPLAEGESIAFILRTVEKVEFVDSTYFYKGFSTPYPIDSYRLLVVFPRGVLPEVRTFNRTLPNCCSADTFQRSTSIPPDGVAIQEGRVTLMWERSLGAGESFEVGIHLPNDSRPAYLLLSLILLGAAFLVGFHYAKRRRRAEVASVFLNEEERAIVEFIRSQGGEVLQENIWKSEVLPFSRPKVSRIISDLEARGLIVREPYKKTFRVRLNV